MRKGVKGRLQNLTNMINILNNRPYNSFSTQTITSISLTPILGGTTGILYVGKGLEYIIGNSVIVIANTNSSNRFEGIVSSYNSSNGELEINNIVKKNSM